MFNKLHNWIIFSPLVLAVLMAVAILLLQKSLPSNIPLFYSMPWGDKQLASPSQLFIIPSLIALITLMNLAISKQLHQQQSFFKNALILTSIVISLILVITFAKIIFIFILG